MKVNFNRFSSHASVPTRETPGSACFNVYSAESVPKTVGLDLGMKFAKKYVCRIYPRSGLSLKSIFLEGGVVDSDYRGNISVTLTNFSSSNIDIERGDKIAQMVFEKRSRFY